MDKIEQIKAEIENELSIHDKVDHLEAFEVGKAWNRGHKRALEGLLSFVDSLQDKPDEDLEEAAEEYGTRQGLELKPFAIRFFKAGANWHKDQTRDEHFWNGMQHAKEELMKEAVEAHVNAFNDNGKHVAEFSTDIPVDGLGEKVRIIILKQENQ